MVSVAVCLDGKDEEEVWAWQGSSSFLSFMFCIQSWEGCCKDQNLMYAKPQYKAWVLVGGLWLLVGIVGGQTPKPLSFAWNNTLPTSMENDSGQRKKTMGLTHSFSPQDLTPSPMSSSLSSLLQVSLSVNCVPTGCAHTGYAADYESFLHLILGVDFSVSFWVNPRCQEPCAGTTFQELWASLLQLHGFAA